MTDNVLDDYLADRTSTTMSTEIEGYESGSFYKTLRDRTIRGTNAIRDNLVLQDEIEHLAAENIQLKALMVTAIRAIGNAHQTGDYGNLTHLANVVEVEGLQEVVEDLVDQLQPARVVLQEPFHSAFYEQEEERQKDQQEVVLDFIEDVREFCQIDDHAAIDQALATKDIASVLDIVRCNFAQIPLLQKEVDQYERITEKLEEQLLYFLKTA